MRAAAQDPSRIAEKAAHRSGHDWATKAIGALLRHNPLRHNPLRHNRYVRTRATTARSATRLSNASSRSSARSTADGWMVARIEAFSDGKSAGLSAESGQGISTPLDFVT